MRFCIFLAFAFASLFSFSAEKKKVLFIAGKDSQHHGNHEHRAGCHLLADRLNAAEIGIEAKVIEGWPKDKESFENLSALVIFCEGAGKHILKKRFGIVDKLADEGVGLGFIHFTLEVEPGKESTYMDKWIGGFYEDHFSTNPRWISKVVVNKKNEVMDGVKDFSILEEWFFNFRFSKTAKIKPLLTSTPSDEVRKGETSHPRGPYPHIVAASGREEVLAWTMTRQNGGRSFAFGGGHYHKNWQNDDFRKTVLNAIAWTAGVKLPRAGVKSESPKVEELMALASVAPESGAWERERKSLSQAKLLYRSPVIKGIDNKPIEKELELGGAKELILVVLDGGDGIIKDHGVWISPKFKKANSEKQLIELKWEAALTGWKRVTINKGIEGGRLEVGGKVVKGIGTHALSIIRYKIPEGFNKFSTIMALLDSNQSGGSIQFQVYSK